MKIYTELAKKAFEEHICALSSLDISEAAIGAIKISNSLMSKILRIVTIERGLDPREFILVAFGGAGPMHACALSEELGVKKIVIPIYPGLFSALGLIVTDYKYMCIKPILKSTNNMSVEEIKNVFLSLKESVVDELKKLKFGDEKIVVNYYLEARYLGQGYELLVAIPPVDSLRSIEQVNLLFESMHERVYGYMIEDAEVEIVNARVEAIGIMEKIVLPEKKKRNHGDIKNAVISKREVYFDSLQDFVRVDIYDYRKLCFGDRIMGPAIVEMYDSTVIIEAGWNLFVDTFGNIILERD